MINVLITYPFQPEHMDNFPPMEGMNQVFSREPTPEELSAAEVIVGWLPVEQLAQAKNLKFYQAVYAGVEMLVSEPRFPQGVILCNASGAFGTAISEYVLTMVLMLYKQMGLYRDNQNQRLWQDEGRQESPMGKTLLILGAGDIGTSTAKLFRPFGCHIIGLRRVPRACPPEFDEIITQDGLDEALTRSDIVVGALPSTSATIGLLNREQLERMKPSAVLVNVGRGNLIDCDALAQLLQEGRLLGAGLDVTDPEPLPPEHPLWTCRNALITPHITGGSFGHLKATEDFIYALCRDNLARYRDGLPLRNVVDRSTGYKQTE
ncbi:MAG: D-2-hydroxyacid dehydrogenase [Oscillospiraceae bacterium]|nr:D-2-hydroxyacid dehydrogenase [Oscillospiraceae bacterium]